MPLRREVVSVTGLSLAVAALAISQAEGQSAPREEQLTGRVVLFGASGFPVVDGDAQSTRATLGQAASGLSSVEADSPTTLPDALRDNASVLVLPYGSAFPLDAWPAIKGFLDGGGGLVVLGGAPFAQPVRLKDGKYVLGLRHPTYAHELLIGPADVVDEEDIAGPARVVGLNGWTGTIPEPSQTYALTVRLGYAEGHAERARLGGPEGRRAPAAGAGPRPGRHPARGAGHHDRSAAGRRGRRALGVRAQRRAAGRGRDPPDDRPGARRRGAGRGSAGARRASTRARRRASASS